MHFSSAFVLAAIPFLVSAAVVPETHTTIGLTKRTSLVKPDGAVDPVKLRSHLARTTAKIQRGLAAYKRNTGEVHPSATHSGAVKREVGSDALTDDGEELWYGSVSVGTPAETYTVDFDTGSSDLFLPASTCGSTCSGHSKYTPSSSSTAKSLGKSFSLAYGDGSTVTGTQYSDTVSLAGLSATTQTLGAATKNSTGFESSEFSPDGLLGMAYKSISDYNANPVFQTLVAQGKTSSSVFAFKLATSGSSLTVGGTDSSLYTGSFSYAPVTQQGYWQVNADSISVGSTTVLGTTSSIIDTGTTLIVGPPSDVATFYKSVPGAADASSTVGAGYYTFPCSSVPSVSWSFGGQTFPVSADSFNLGPASSGSSQCVGGVVGQDTGIDGWIVGDVFLRNAYTVFDVANNRVGFASLA